VHVCAADRSALHADEDVVVTDGGYVYVVKLDAASRVLFYESVHEKVADYPESAVVHGAAQARPDERIVVYKLLK